MDPFDFFTSIRRPVPVKASCTTTDLDFDETLIDKILGTPEKIDIPERYIPEEEPQLEPEEERKRSQKAEAICRLLSKSNGGAGIPLNPVRLPSVNTKVNRLSFHQQEGLLEEKGRRGGSCNSYPRERSYQQGSQYSGGSLIKSVPSGNVAGIVHSTPASPVKRTTSLRKPGSAPGSGIGGGGGHSRHSFIQNVGSQKCDWSLAGVCAPKEVRGTQLSATERLFGNKRPPPPSVYGFGLQGHRNSPSSYLNESGIGGSRSGGIESSSSNAAFLSGSGGNRRIVGGNSSGGVGDSWRSRNEVPRSSLQPNHSYNSSYSSSCSSGGRSSADREELLHLQQYLAKEVTEKSRLVAVRALASSPGPRHDFSHQRYRDPSPPSPVELPIVQQREGFFT